MILVEKRALPTVSGFATAVRPEITAANRSPVRVGAVREYVRQRKPHASLCGLNLDQGRRVFPLPGPAPLPPDNIRFTGDDANDAVVRTMGRNGHEADGGWTPGRRVLVDLTLPPGDNGRGLRLDPTTLPFLPPHGTALPVTAIGALKWPLRFADYGRSLSDKEVRSCPPPSAHYVRQEACAFRSAPSLPPASSA